MGVTKVLMASNDTLFNFEDTLGDRDDMFSPRHHSAATDTNGSITPQPSIECKTPTNDLLVPSIDDSSEASTLNEPLSKPVLLNLTLDSNATNLNELMSPEQQKTFSEEINTVESSDLSATVEGNTNTLDDLKTCISVHLNDETNKSVDKMVDMNGSSISDDGLVQVMSSPKNDGIDADAGQLANSMSDDSSMHSSLDSLESIEMAGKSKVNKHEKSTVSAICYDSIQHFVTFI